MFAQHRVLEVGVARQPGDDCRCRSDVCRLQRKVQFGDLFAIDMFANV